METKFGDPLSSTLSKSSPLIVIIMVNSTFYAIQTQIKTIWQIANSTICFAELELQRLDMK